MGEITLMVRWSCGCIGIPLGNGRCILLEDCRGTGNILFLDGPVPQDSKGVERSWSWLSDVEHENMIKRISRVIGHGYRFQELAHLLNLKEVL